MLNKYLTLLIINLLFCLSFNAKAAEKQCVILLHGLIRTHHSMESLETLLRNNHYIVVNEDYPSTKKPIKMLAEQYIPQMVKECKEQHTIKINFVTHSLGGIILRQYLRTHTIQNLNRIVMLGPPNHGSEFANVLHHLYLFKMITGPAGQELTTYRMNIPNHTRINSSYQIGIIAGYLPRSPFNRLIFHNANDGTVTIESTQLKSMHDFIIISSMHSFMMNNRIIQKQILNFLKSGKFIHSS